IENLETFFLEGAETHALHRSHCLLNHGVGSRLILGWIGDDRLCVRRAELRSVLPSEAVDLALVLTLVLIRELDPLLLVQLLHHLSLASAGVQDGVLTCAGESIDEANRRGDW